MVDLGSRRLVSAGVAAEAQTCHRRQTYVASSLPDSRVAIRSGRRPKASPPRSGAREKMSPVTPAPRLSAKRLIEELVSLWRVDHDEDRQADAKRNCQARALGPFCGDEVLGRLLHMPWHRGHSCRCRSRFGCEVAPAPHGSSLHVARCLAHRRGRRRNSALGLQEMFEAGEKFEISLGRKAIANGYDRSRHCA